MIQYKNIQENRLINYLTPDKKSGNTIVGHVTLLLQNTHVSFTVHKLRYSSQVIFLLWFSHRMEVYL